MAAKNSTPHFSEGPASHADVEAASRALPVHQDINYSMFNPPDSGLRRQYPHEVFTSVPVSHGYGNPIGDSLDPLLNPPFTSPPQRVPQWPVVPFETQVCQPNTIFSLYVFDLCHARFLVVHRTCAVRILLLLKAKLKLYYIARSNRWSTSMRFSKFSEHYIFLILYTTLG